MKELQTKQVFIYYHSDSLKKFNLPDCLGTLITALYVLTGASCFINEQAYEDKIKIKNAVVVGVNKNFCLLKNIKKKCWYLFLIPDQKVLFKEGNEIYSNTQNENQTENFFVYSKSRI